MSVAVHDQPITCVINGIGDVGIRQTQARTQSAKKNPPEYHFVINESLQASLQTVSAASAANIRNAQEAAQANLIKVMTSLLNPVTECLDAVETGQAKLQTVAAQVDKHFG